jgi:hypothetical protein
MDLPNQVLSEIISVRITHAIEDFKSPAGQRFADECARRANDGDTEAFFAPAVRLGVDTTIGYANHLLIEPDLPSEVAERSLKITKAAKKITSLCIDLKVFQALYMQSSLGDVHMDADDMVHLVEKSYMSKLVSAPFGDVKWAGGGAFRLLQEAGAEDPAESIKQSKNLMAINGISKKKGEEALDYLGDIYVGTEHLRLVDGDPVTVAFSRIAMREFHNWYEEGGGCPAGRLPDAEFGTTMERYWPQIVDVMIPDYATVVHPSRTEELAS